MAHWPQLFTVIWLGLSIPGHAYGAGKKDSAHEASVHLIVGVLRCAIPLWVLYLGGFFAVWGWAP